MLTGLSSSASEATAGERSVVAETAVNADRAAVWKTLTTTEGVTTFFAPNAHVELRHGGPYEIYFNMDEAPGRRGSEGCKIVGYVPGEMLAFTWNAPPKFGEMRGKRTFVVIRLSDAGEGRTRVHLVNGGYQAGEKWDEVFAYFSKAWPHVLENLRKRFESGPLWEQHERKQHKARRLKQYAYFIKMGRPGLGEDPTPEEQQAVGGHVAYLEQLLADDKLVFAGRASDPPQVPDEHALSLGAMPLGIVVFEATGEEEAKRIMEKDPAIEAGALVGCVHPFGVFLDRP
jgi:uncharacterized protein YndB with AHSA1/START domain/uncharacterized protein YciI